MDFVDNVISKAKELYDVTSDKVEGVIDASKLKVKLSTVAGKVCKDYEALGRLYYQSVKLGDADADAFDQLVEQIDQKEQEMASLAKDLDQQMGKVSCECGAKNAPEAAYCSACGKKLGD